ncbi:signal peptidase I [Pelomonas sp. SE-A7]|uniref:signal peptidase I n=1 Tax=Pelomonas sp. SE-A7 TaxID=3054953 RepID=UPI00259C7E5A|nr:signal peptidase I [Pelomonas sp. SE-A7]MDM4768562.1 signal peptidase I [Pelomonas sp. SE-A7]
MLGKILRHFVVPRATLAADKLGALLKGESSFRVQGRNMEPTLSQGTICRYRSLSSEEQMAPGSIVAFIHSEFSGHIVPSRVLAGPNDTIEITDGELVVNGQKVVEPYIRRDFSVGEYSTQLPKQTVPSGSYFLLGDYRDASQDSRYFGPVPRSTILGLIVERA